MANERKKAAAGIGLVALSNFGSYELGKSVVDQVVVIRPPLAQVMTENPSKTQLANQLEEAGIEVLIDDISSMDPTTPKQLHTEEQ